MCDMMGAMGAGMAVWIVVGFALLALAVAATVWLVRGLTAPGRAHPQLPPVDAAQEALRHRYVAGEIEREEFLQRKVDLER
jgi:putative membrane protein